MITTKTPIAKKAKEVFEKRIKEWLDNNQAKMPVKDVEFCESKEEGYNVTVKDSKAVVFASSKIEFMAGAGELIRMITKAVCNDESVLKDCTVQNKAEISGKTLTCRDISEMP